MDMVFRTARRITSLETGENRDLLAMAVTEQGEVTLTLDYGEVWQFTPYTRIGRVTGWTRENGDITEYMPQTINLSLLTPDNIQAAGRRMKQTDFAEIILKSPCSSSEKIIYGTLRVLQPALSSTVENKPQPTVVKGENADLPKTSAIPQSDTLTTRQIAAFDFLEWNARPLSPEMKRLLGLKDTPPEQNSPRPAASGRHSNGVIHTPAIQAVGNIALSDTSDTDDGALIDKGIKGLESKREHKQWPRPTQENVATLWRSYRSNHSSARLLDCYTEQKNRGKLPNGINSVADFKKCLNAAKKNGILPPARNRRKKNAGKVRET